MLKQSLQQKLQQKLSPQQIQLMKLLQVPTLELEARIKEELEANPALEEGREEEDDFDGAEGLDDDRGETRDDFDFDSYLDDSLKKRPRPIGPVWSGRHPVTVEITGSNPVWVADLVRYANG